MTDGRIPISDEQAKAIAEAIKALQGLGDFLNKTFGIHLQNLIGYLGGDWLGVRRARKTLRT